MLHADDDPNDAGIPAVVTQHCFLADAANPVLILSAFSAVSAVACVLVIVGVPAVLVSPVLQELLLVHASQLLAV
jgi:hypothetical protein